jgi:hypothetical protein
MKLQSLQFITSALAPVIMVSASGLLFSGIQAKHLHSADRMRALMTDYRSLGSALRSLEPYKIGSGSSPP